MTYSDSDDDTEPTTGVSGYLGPQFFEGDKQHIEGGSKHRTNRANGAKFFEGDKMHQEKKARKTRQPRLQLSVNEKIKLSDKTQNLVKWYLSGGKYSGFLQRVENTLKSLKRENPTKTSTTVTGLVNLTELYLRLTDIRKESGVISKYDLKPSLKDKSRHGKEYDTFIMISEYKRLKRLMLKYEIIRIKRVKNPTTAEKEFLGLVKERSELFANIGTSHTDGVTVPKSHVNPDRTRGHGG